MNKNNSNSFVGGEGAQKFASLDKRFIDNDKLPKSISQVSYGKQHITFKHRSFNMFECPGLD
jgi:hypothetical protein